MLLKITLTTLTGAFYALPQCALAAIIFISLLGLLVVYLRRIPFIDYFTWQECFISLWMRGSTGRSRPRTLSSGSSPLWQRWSSISPLVSSWFAWMFNLYNRVIGMACAVAMSILIVLFGTAKPYATQLVPVSHVIVVNVIVIILVYRLSGLSCTATSSVFGSPSMCHTCTSTGSMPPSTLPMSTASKYVLHCLWHPFVDAVYSTDWSAVIRVYRCMINHPFTIRFLQCVPCRACCTWPLSRRPLLRKHRCTPLLLTSGLFVRT